jgi:hypothetical protein
MKDHIYLQLIMYQNHMEHALKNVSEDKIKLALNRLKILSYWSYWSYFGQLEQILENLQHKEPK